MNKIKLDTNLDKKLNKVSLTMRYPSEVSDSADNPQMRGRELFRRYRLTAKKREVAKSRENFLNKFLSPKNFHLEIFAETA